MKRIAMLVLLAACGGGGGGGEHRPAPRPPSPATPVVREPAPERPAPLPVLEPPAPPAPAEPVLALNVQPAGDSLTASVYLDRLEDVGVRHVRMSWWAWSTVDSWSWLPRYRAAGVEVLPLVYGVPGAHPDSIGRSIAGRYRALYDAFGPFPYVQLDNEADGGGPFAVPAGDPYEQGQRWGRQMREAADLIRTFDPEVRFVTAGVAWVHPGVQEWVRGMAEARCCDVLALHVYGAHLWGEPLGRYTQVREAGWKGPIWATEIGVEDAAARYMVREPDVWQLANWRNVLTVDPSRHGYARLYGFQLSPDGHGYGILERDLSPRPAYFWLKEWHGDGRPVVTRTLISQGEP